MAVAGWRSDRMERRNPKYFESSTPLLGQITQKSIADLTPGKLFAYQGRTVGGSTTYSDWSDLTVQRAA